jgi:Uma2 family endonuclease
MSPSPAWVHNRVGNRLWLALTQQLPAGLEANQDLDLNLELVGPARPGFVRRPDLVVARRDAVDRLATEGGVLRASDVVLVVELVSPSSVRTDNVIKRGEYADAGIPHYWIVDLTEPVSLVACHLAGAFGYADASAATGRFVTTEPFKVEIDLDALR